MSTVLKAAAIFAAAEVAFLALWIAAHGGLKDDATVTREFAADAVDYRTQIEASS